jgi:hypothetical protein
MRLGGRGFRASAPRHYAPLVEHARLVEHHSRSLTKCDRSVSIQRLSPAKSARTRIDGNSMSCGRPAQTCSDRARIGYARALCGAADWLEGPATGSPPSSGLPSTLVNHDSVKYPHRGYDE